MILMLNICDLFEDGYDGGNSFNVRVWVDWNKRIKNNKIIFCMLGCLIIIVII